ncbi:MAG TPA: methyltransferase domain-containing protein [Flavisolibacter sp.]|jgi:16S rRNA (cytosine967-C5)-methyltransferase|nr:methyltransferase domain-containing protein [Flavisolibacter sp.]
MQLMAHVRSAAEIVTQYNGEVPFASWLKTYFRNHKKFGSKDRKRVADLCFCYFRLGHAFEQFSTEDRILAGQFLCHSQSEVVAQCKPAWQQLNSAPLVEKLHFLDAGAINQLFPFPGHISPEIDKDAFLLSFLRQPDVFLRLRPGKEKNVADKLQSDGVSFLQEGACLRLQSGTKADEILRIDEEVVVQDISSQRVLEPLRATLTKMQFSAWDCCAASGGKTILLHDMYPKARLTVSDIRESIILNLKNRLKRAGITDYRSFVTDVSSPQFSLSQQFDVIICDAPCSGSGTWGRTPEQLVFFKKEKIAHYTGLQQSIATNASKCLKKGGLFLYITCSVFIDENEQVVKHLTQTTGLQLLSQQYFKGYDKKGDTLFAALFTI